MGIGMTRIQHVKIPVTDLRSSVAWYAQLLDLVPFREFVEQGAVRGAALRSPEADVVLALRERRFCANHPDLAGFDLVALLIADRERLGELAAKCDRLGIQHSPIQDRGPDEAAIDVPDPDRTILRFFWQQENQDTRRFIGLSFDMDGPPTLYNTPRLPIPPRG
jgi:catechol 2,3-dioxygenase-like lactoylglutathione lyase family enzyme